MANYDIVYTCGHTGVIGLFGHSSEREWRKSREEEKLCPDCFEAELKKKNEEALKASQELDLPELTGSPKQVEWATTLRLKALTTIREDSKLSTNPEIIYRILDYLSREETEARFWIDRRGYSSSQYLNEAKKVAMKSEEEKFFEKAVEEEKKDATVYPEKRITEGVVEIIVTTDKVEAKFEKNEKYNDIVRSLHYDWNGKAWCREIDYSTGSSEDRAAELGNRLLNTGFPISILDVNLRQKAISGDFEPESRNWISKRTSGEYEGWFTISWDGRDDVLYRTARRLPGSKWDKGVVVKPEHYKTVLDFARLMKFRLSPGAEKIVEEQETKSRTVVSPSAPPAAAAREDGLKDILKSSREVLDDLKD